eukprot:6643462-Prymnesium_polylepis.2
MWETSSGLSFESWKKTCRWISNSPQPCSDTSNGAVSTTAAGAKKGGAPRRPAGAHASIGHACTSCRRLQRRVQAGVLIGVGHPHVDRPLVRLALLGTLTEPMRARANDEALGEGRFGSGEGHSSALSGELRRHCKARAARRSRARLASPRAQVCPRVHGRLAMKRPWLSAPSPARWPPSSSQGRSHPSSRRHSSRQRHASARQRHWAAALCSSSPAALCLSLIHISEPTRRS